MGIKLKTYVLNTEDKTIYLKRIYTKRLSIKSLTYSQIAKFWLQVVVYSFFLLLVFDFIHIAVFMIAWYRLAMINHQHSVYIIYIVEGV